MRKVPHHAPLHMFLDWKTFVTTPWTMPRVGKDLEIENVEEVICQQNFRFNEINSCHIQPYPDGYVTWKRHFSEHEPFYELKNDGSGRAYASILNLRSDKIKNFMTVIPQLHFVRHFLVQHYERLLEQGTSDLLHQIEELTGIKAECTPSLPQNRRHRKLDRHYLEWMKKYVDWDTEARIGYNKCAYIECD